MILLSAVGMHADPDRNRLLVCVSDPGVSMVTSPKTQKKIARLVAFARLRLKAQLTRRGAPPSEVARAEEVLDPEALTIGFARRFATYKRAELIFRDPERLARILNSAKHPVQVIFAGKAHPADDGGKRVLQTIYRHAIDPLFAPVSPADASLSV